MSPSAVLVRVFICQGLLIPLGGCSMMPPPSPMDYASSQSMEAGKSLVLGRIRIIDNYRESPFLPWKRVPHRWRQKAWRAGVPGVLGAGYRDLFLFRIDATNPSSGQRMGRGSRPFDFAPRDDGTFVWSLYPGTYSIRGGTYASGVLVYEFGDFPNGGPRFTVPADTLVYIGTPTFLMPDQMRFDEDLMSVLPFGPENIFIEDDRDQALKRLSELAPGSHRFP